MARLSVLFVAPHPIEGPSTRFRICQFLPALDNAGIRPTLRPFVSSSLAPILYGRGRLPLKLSVTALGTALRAVDVLRATRVDLVYVLREAFPIGPGIFERLMDTASGRFAYDFDDAIWCRATNYDNPLDRLRDWKRPAKLIGRATRTVVGSPILAGYARRHARNPDNVVTIPTVVDTRIFHPSPRGGDGTVVVGWIGTPRNTSYIQAIWPELVDAHRRAPSIRYVFVGADAFDTGGVPVEFRRWSLADEVAEIQKFDVGIMPLPDDEQARGKCGFKLIAYMACGVPCVASPVGANTHVLANGSTGLLVGETLSWSDALVALAGDADRRRHLSTTGRTWVEANYSLEVMAPKFVSTIIDAAGG